MKIPIELKSNTDDLCTGTNPLAIDSDGDGLADGDGGVILTSVFPDGVDADGDGYVDGERSLGTNPSLEDSDGGQLNDWNPPECNIPRISVNFASGRIRCDSAGSNLRGYL